MCIHHLQIPNFFVILQCNFTSFDMHQSPKWIGHLAAFTAYLIFGFNIIVCKDLTSSQYVSPIGIFLLRSIGAGAIFWLLSLFLPRERVSKRDLLGIFCASVLGFFLTQITFLMAIPIVTPMESSIMSSMSPVYTMLIAAIVLREPLTWLKAAGVALSLGGILYLIITSMGGGAQGGNIYGLALMAANALCFSLYLGIFRPLISRYSVVTFMKWIFLFSLLMALPIGVPALASVEYSAIPGHWYWELAYLIVMATFVAYFLIPVGQKIIRPTLVSMYSYVQPIVAIGISIAIGMESLTVVKVVASILVFLGVYIVSRSKKAPR